MKETLTVKLAPDPEQCAGLMMTLEAFNAACNAIAVVAFRQRCANKIALQKLVYYDTRERRFQRDTNHVIAKTVVARAKDTRRGIGLEDLKHIRSRVSVGKAQRRVIHGWAFAQLGAFLGYKATAAGVVVVRVDPRHTSQTCAECGHVARGNRPSQAVFSCQSCGHRSHADTNAAQVIAARAGLPGHAAERLERTHRASI